MNTEIKEENSKENNLKEKIRLDKSYINYHEIIDKSLPYKFSYLDEWLLKKSKLLTNEANNLIMQLEEPENIKKQRFRTYQRGSIIKVDFGVGIGSEMSQIHFAIVLNNYDNPKNNILTVVPLTSKENKFNLYLGTLIIDALVSKIQKELEPIDLKVNNNEDLTIEENTKLKKLKTLISYYKSNVKSTFACCSLITTISKERIFLPINEYDIIGRAKCPSNIMNMIDNEIKNRFISQNLTSASK